MAVMTRHTFPKDLAPGIEAHLGLNLDKVAPVFPKIFMNRKTNRAWVEYVMMAGLGAARQKMEGGATELDEMAQGWSIYIRVQSWALGFSITQEAIEDNLYHDPVEIGSRELVQSFAHAKEIVHASHINNAFSSSYLGGDGKALAALDHPSVYPSVPAYRNTLTIQADFGEEALEQAIIDISMMTNERGIPTNIEPRQLVIPPALMFEEIRVLRGKLRPGTADNDLSALNYAKVLNGDPIIWKYMTDPKMFMILTDVNESEGFVTTQRIPFTPKKWGDDRTGNYFVTARERYGSGWRNPRCSFIVSAS